VIVHSDSTLTELRRLGAEPSASRTIPARAVHRARRQRSCAKRAGRASDQFLFFGQVLPYKGVEDLPAALGPPRRAPGAADRGRCLP